MSDGCTCDDDQDFDEIMMMFCFHDDDTEDEDDEDDDDAWGCLRNRNPWLITSTTIITIIITITTEREIPQLPHMLAACTHRDFPVEVFIMISITYSNPNEDRHVHFP